MSEAGARRFACPSCQAPVRVVDLLAAVTGYQRASRSATSPCPACKSSLEFQVRSGRVTLGTTYWAGAPHFEGLFDVPARGLRCVEGEDGVHYEFEGVRYDVPGTDPVASMKGPKP